mgnify:CR=1 FL=1
MRWREIGLLVALLALAHFAPGVQGNSKMQHGAKLMLMEVRGHSGYRCSLTVSNRASFRFSACAQA